MMRAGILFAAALCSGCNADERRERRAAEDARAVAMVERAQDAHPPIQPAKLETIVFADIEKNDLFGAGCTFSPQGSADMLFLGDDVRGAVKIGGKIVVLASDSGSPELPFGARERYTGKAFSVQVGKGAGDGDETGPETVRWPGSLTIRDQWERITYSEKGTLTCGA